MRYLAIALREVKVGFCWAFVVFVCGYIIRYLCVVVWWFGLL